MNDLLARAIAAHGGLDRWNKFKKVSATYIGGGGLWPMKGLEVIPNPGEVTVMLHEETSSISPFQRPDWHASSRPTGLRSKPPLVRSSASAPIQEHLLLVTLWRRRGMRFTVRTLWATHMDLPHDAILYDIARLRGDRNLAMARRW